MKERHVKERHVERKACKRKACREYTADNVKDIKQKCKVS